jgi:hypothetical protein
MARSVCALAATAVFFMVSSAAATKNCSECHKLQLTGKDFSQWRANTAQWQIVGGARLKPADEKALLAEPGDDAILNGSAGRTANLFSKAEVQTALDKTLQKLLAHQGDSFESGETLLARWNHIEVNEHVYRRPGHAG